MDGGRLDEVYGKRNYATREIIEPAHTPHSEPARNIFEKPDESESEGDVSRMWGREVILMMGYTRGGTQVREAGERQSSSCWAVGRVELDSLQHDCTNSQSVPEKPKDSASGGSSGRSPPSTAVTGEYERK